MINVSSHHVLSAKVEHVKAMEKEVKRQLEKYKGIFDFLVKHQRDNSLRFDAEGKNSVKAVINLSGPTTKTKSHIDGELNCILREYRTHAIGILNMLKRIEVDIKKILEADRKGLIKLIQEHDYSTLGLDEKNMNKIFEKIFNYDAFSGKSEKKYSGYTLTKNLKIIACPYCNRTYTLTVICKSKTTGTGNDYITRPELDHYFPKSKYPIFALSFYNLIPSCGICNNLKGDRTDHYNMHHHPYIDETKLEFHLDGIKYDSTSNKFNSDDEWGIVLDAKSCKYTQKSIEIFYLSKLYGEHNLIVKDMIEKAQEYNQTFIDSVESLFKGIKNPENQSEVKDVEFEREELLERVFGVLPSEEDCKNPMSKFKRGIYKSIRKAQSIKTNLD